MSQDQVETVGGLLIGTVAALVLFVLGAPAWVAVAAGAVTTVWLWRQ
jgi:sterol desaturase/sphingolipid hydroxylase (fatty acid hydroxylase superfamily)